MRGERVTVLPEGVAVDDVLVQPGSGVQPTDPCAPPGSPAIVTAHFPKSFAGELAGRQVEVRGRVLDVVGEPVRYQAANTPTRWDVHADLADFRMAEPFALYREEASVDALGDPTAARTEVCSGLCRVVPSESYDAAGAADAVRSGTFDLWCRWGDELAALCGSDTRGLVAEAAGMSLDVQRVHDPASLHRCVRVRGAVRDG